MNFLLILDAGHGGLHNGHYHCLAGGKKYKHRPPHEFHGNGWFFEGVWNRRMVNAIAEQARQAGIETKVISHEYLDISLTQRVRTINALAKGRNALMISCHANASPSHTGRGWEVFTSPGRTRSDKFAEILTQKVQDTKLMRMRGIKEARFTMVTGTHCPAVLVEWGFFDQVQDALILHDEKNINRFAEATIKAIQQYLKT
jgi:N-acetylmuramoyl-L-alanine amidase